MLLKVTAIKSAMKHHGGSVFGKKQMPGVETHHLRQSSETLWKGSQLLSLYKRNRREQTKSYLVFVFKSSHSWCLLFTQNAAYLEILLSISSRKICLILPPLKIDIIKRNELCCTGFQYTRRQNYSQVHILDQICNILAWMYL